MSSPELRTISLDSGGSGLTLNTTSPTNVETEPTSGNVTDDAAPMRNDSRKLRVFAVLSFIFNLVFVFDLWFMYSEGGRLETENDESEILFTFAAIATVTVVYVGLNVYNTFQGTKSRTETLDWDFQHLCFVRMMKAYVVNLVCLFPAGVSYVFYSRGDRFGNFVDSVDSEFKTVLSWHIASAIALLVMSASGAIYTHYTLKYGLFKKEMTAAQAGLMAQQSQFAAAEDEALGLGNMQDDNTRVSCCECTGKLLSVGILVVTILFNVGLIWALSLGYSTGVLMSLIVYFLVEVPVIRHNIQLIMRSSRSRDWWLAYRAITGVHLGVAYIIFWLCLLLIVLLGSHEPGFWTVVKKLPTERSDTIYRHFVNFFFYTGFTIWRTYLLKLKKKMRAERVFHAIPIVRQVSSGTYNAADESRHPNRGSMSQSLVAMTREHDAKTGRRSSEAGNYRASVSLAPVLTLHHQDESKETIVFSDNDDAKNTTAVDDDNSEPAVATSEVAVELE